MIFTGIGSKNAVAYAYMCALCVHVNEAAIAATRCSGGYIAAVLVYDF